MSNNHDPESLFFKEYSYSLWSKNKEESTDKKEFADKGESVDLSDILPLESYEEKVREGKGIKIVRCPNVISTNKTWK